MKVTYTIVLLLLSCFVEAQQVTSISYGTPDDEEGYSQPLSNNQYLVVGQIKHKGNRSDMMLSKLDSNFVVIWSQIYDISQAERFWNVLELADGNLLFTATSSGSRSNADYTYLGLINGTTGKIVWIERRGGNQDRLPFMKLLDDGSIMQAGMLEGETGSPWNKFTLAKRRADFGIEWQYYYDHLAPQSTEPKSGEINVRDNIIEVEDGFILMGTHNIGAIRGMRLLKTNKVGDLQWVRQYIYPVDYNVEHIVPFTKSGIKGYLIAGGIEDPINGYGVGILTFLDENGNHIWTKNYVGGRYTRLSYIAIMDDSSAVAVGTVEGTGQDGRNVLALKINKEGGLDWAKTYGGDFDDEGKRVYSHNGCLLISGETKSTPMGDKDIYIIKTDSSGDILRECMREVTPDITIFTVKPIELITTYSRGVVPNPIKVSLSSENLVINKNEICAGCTEIELGLTDMSICDGNPLVVKMPPMRGDYTWSTGHVGRSITITEPGIYWLEAANECDTVKESFNVDKRNTPTVPDLHDTFVCFENTVHYSLTPTSNHNYIWQPLDSIADSIDLKAGSYILQAVNYCGALKDGFIIKSVGDYELIIDDTTECLYKSVTFDLSSYQKEGVNLYWPHLNDSSAVVTISDSGQYTLITERCNIVKEQSFRLNWVTEDVYVPSAFTPNGAGPSENELFNVGSFVRDDEFMLQVFNRWGELIFRTTSISQGWDGTYKGKPVPQGAYLYVLAVKDCDGHMQYTKGTVTLLR